MTLLELHATPAAPTAPRRLPPGYGLLAGGLVSLALWVGLAWLALQAF
jgi:hypothetical protein